MKRSAIALLAVLSLIGAACSSTDPEPKSLADLVKEDLPTAWWAFEETSGTVAKDKSGNAHDAAYINSPALGSTVGPKLGAGITVTGSPDGVRADYASWMDLTSLTIEAWVKPTKVTYAQSILIVDKGESWGLQVSSTGQPAFAFPHSVGRATAANPMQIGQLYHLAATFQGGVIKIYVNGVLAATDAQAAAAPAKNGEPLHIGRGLSSPGFDFEGGIDEVALYDHALTEVRIKAHCDAGL